MGKPTGFKEYPAKLAQKAPGGSASGDFKEIYLPFPRSS
jgi:hypothetical protein